jgi:hypothetical protein
MLHKHPLLVTLPSIRLYDYQAYADLCHPNGQKGSTKTTSNAVIDHIASQTARVRRTADLAS